MSMQPNVPSAWSILNQVAAFSGETPTIYPYTTLNEKLSIQQTATLSPGEKPVISCYVIGNGNHFNMTSASGLPKSKNKGHYADSAALYNQIPFVIRPITNDLSETDRAKYALRKTITVSGVSYYAYYAKRFSLANITSALYKVSQVNGSQVATPYVPTDASLNPSPPPVDENGVIITSGEYIRASKVVEIVFGETDAEELRNVAEILYGDESDAIVSEIGICSSVDRVINITTTLGGATFNETVANQIAAFCPALSFSDFATRGFKFTTTLGGTAPMLGAEQITSGTVQDYTP